jgi:menaquinone-9 beta-reductase
VKAKFDVAIVGGGPAGSLCARQLALGGFSVIVLERAATIRRKVCGEYLCPSGVSLLKSIGLKEEIVDQFLPITGMQIFALNRYHVDATFPSHGGKQLGIAVNRESLDRKFLDLAQAAGVTVRLGTTVNQITSQGSDGFLLQLKDSEQIEANLLVGADGRHSFTARELGLKEGIDTSKVALQCHLQAKQLNRRQGEMHIFSDGNYIGIDPTGEYEVNLSLVCDSSLFKQEKNPRALLNSFIMLSDQLEARYGSIPESVGISSVTPLTNHMDKIVAKNATLIGDAAGFLDPLTGEGMFVALWSANTLASELTNVGVGKSSHLYQQALTRYAERKRVFFRHKVILNTAFQFIIKIPWLIWLIAALIKRRERGDIFLGIIGNIYSPLEGLKRLLKV